MSSTVALSPVTAVYSLLREPSLALLWTHGYTFRVRSPSQAGILPLNRGSAHGSRQSRASEGSNSSASRPTDTVCICPTYLQRLRSE